MFKESYFRIHELSLTHHDVRNPLEFAHLFIYSCNETEITLDNDLLPINIVRDKEVSYLDRSQSFITLHHPAGA